METQNKALARAQSLQMLALALAEYDRLGVQPPASFMDYAKRTWSESVDYVNSIRSAVMALSGAKLRETAPIVTEGGVL